jgi:hypothetical protein
LKFKSIEKPLVNETIEKDDSFKKILELPEDKNKLDEKSVKEKVEEKEERKVDK